MNRTELGRFAWLALVAIVASGTLALSSQPGDLDSFGNGCLYALPPPDLCSVCPLLEEPTIELSFLFEPVTLVIGDGYRLPLASRAPPEQA